MSDKSIALETIAKIGGVEVKQLPPLSPEDFALSDWRYWGSLLDGGLLNEFDILQSLMGAYLRAGAEVVCPSPGCKRYAGQLFFQRGWKIPVVFLCQYENRVWYSNGADPNLVDRILRRYKAKLWCEG